MIESETDESVDTDVTSLKSATPTTSERKVQNLYSLPDSDCSVKSEEE